MATPALAVGHRLQHLRIQQVLAVGDTATVYRAFDTDSQRVVVVKEYRPGALCQRTASGQVLPLSPPLAAAYAQGLQAFVNEADLLMALQHPALVPLLRCWRQDGTAYQVMPLLEGDTLHQWLAGLGTPPSEVWLRQLLAPLMDALQALHQRGGHHGNVSLRNIWLQFDNRAGSYLGHAPRPLLLGFGAAGRACSRTTQPGAAAGDNGFAPVEQADGAITVRQGAWTDVYGLCAVMYAAVAGRPPPPSLARMVQDDMVSARKVGRGRYSPSFLAAIDAGLTVRPHERLQDIDGLRRRLDEEPAVGSAAPSHHPPAGQVEQAAAAHGDTAPRRRQHQRPMWLWPASVAALLLLVALVGALLRG